MAQRWWREETPAGTVVVAAGRAGVRAVVYGDAVPPDLAGSADPSADRRVAVAFAAYRSGDPDALDLPVDLDGVDGFRRRVLETLSRSVAWGETITYGELAALAGAPGAARAVGRVMATNPVPIVVPCHRVVAAGGRLGGYGGVSGTAGAAAALDRKRALLAHEGVTDLR